MIESFLKLIWEGGVWFTIPQTVMGFTVLVLGVKALLPLILVDRGVERTPDPVPNDIIIVGSFAFISGLLGQAMALFDALKAIEAMGGVSPAMLAGGLRVSMITVLFGLIIFAGSVILWYAARVLRDHQTR